MDGAIHTSVQKFKYIPQLMENRLGSDVCPKCVKKENVCILKKLLWTTQIKEPRE